MAQIIAALAAGIGVPTVFIDPNGCEQYILVGDIDTANALQGLVVEIDGEPTINILQSPLFMNTLFKWQQNIAGAVVGLLLTIASGFIGRKTKYTFINNGATTPSVFAYSEAGQGVPFRATTTNVNPLANQEFKNFSGLFFQPGNVAQLIVKFKGVAIPKVLTVVEADALFASKNQTEANGRLDSGVSGFDNRDQSIESVTIYANATAGGVNAMIVNFSQRDWQTLKAQAAQ